MNTAFKVGDRVQLHPASSAWMRGDRYGVIEKIGRKWLYVRLDKSGRLGAFYPCRILEVIT